MTTTRQIFYERFGEPGGNLKLRSQDLREPGPGEARVRVVKVPIHPADLAAARGRYGGATEPGVPGIECVAVVEAIPSGRIPVGTRVAVAGATALWSDRAVVDEQVLIPVPEGVSDEVACQLFVNPLTARIMLTALPVEGVSIQAAANSALGRMVNRIAIDEGRQLINVVRRPEAAAILRGEGAVHVVDSSQPDWKRQVASMAGGSPISGALDPIGGATSLALSGLLSPGGVLTVYGGLDNGAAAAVDIGALIFGNISVRGFWLTRWFGTASEDEKQNVVGKVIGEFASGHLKIAVEAEYELADFAAAVAHAEGHKSGKILFAPNH